MIDDSTFRLTVLPTNDFVEIEKSYPVVPIQVGRVVFLIG